MVVPVGCGGFHGMLPILANTAMHDQKPNDREEIIDGLPTERPSFVELFYAVVVGSAVPLLNPRDGICVNMVRVFMLLVVLEDWWGYYRHVLVHRRKRSYTTSSLGYEFTILI